MSKSNPHYLVFPIALLQTGKRLDEFKDGDERASLIIAWCVSSCARKILKEIQGSDTDDPTFVKYLNMAQRQAAAAKKSLEIGPETDPAQIAYLAAQCQLGWICHYDLKACQQEEKRLDRVINRDLGRKLVRIRNDIIEDVKHKRMPWRDFAILAAIYAGCFDKERKAGTLTMSQIGAMALGFGSRKYCSDQTCLHDKAVGRTVERLRKRSLFVKASPDNGRTTYYSNQMNQEQLTAYIAEIQVRRAMKRAKPSNRSISKQINTLVDRMTRFPPSTPPSG